MSDRATLSRVVLATLVAGFVASACGGEGGASTAGAASPGQVASPRAATEVPQESVAPPADGGPASPSATTAGGIMTQPWATASLTDVRTGQAFQIADLVADGKVVFVEPMAIWCSSCRQQQRAAREALAGLDPDDTVWIGLDVELSESAENLAEYADVNDFPFTYAVSNVDLSRALAAEFGDGVLSPPNVNVIVVGSDGSVDHMTGHHGPAELVAIATEAGA